MVCEMRQAVTEIKEQSINRTPQNNFFRGKKSNYAEGIEQSRDNPIDNEQREKGDIMAK